MSGHQSTATIADSLRGQRVFLTGHTGFTGSWLSLWLSEIGCSVAGYALAPNTTPALFDLLQGPERVDSHHLGDIRDFDALSAAMKAAAPTVVMHLAAQPLVRRSYADPLETFSVNVLGTANVLESARQIPSVRAFLSVTTDKVYESREWPYPYRETDRLGGKDPYSASKACAELVTRCYQETMSPLGNGMKVAAVRGGNIIGGGDWSDDRIVPDFYRASTTSTPLVLRFPDAIRPWQHVLSACHGYLSVIRRLLSEETQPTEQWNIGPVEAEAVTVRELVAMLAADFPGTDVRHEETNLKETNTLLLDTHKAQKFLGYRPPWSAAESIRKTSEWYKTFYQDHGSAMAVTKAQLQAYRELIAD